MHAIWHITHTTFTGNTIMATSPSEITVESNLLEDKVQAAVDRQVDKSRPDIHSYLIFPHPGGAAEAAVFRADGGWLLAGPPDHPREPHHRQPPAQLQDPGGVQPSHQRLTGKVGGSSYFSITSSVMLLSSCSASLPSATTELGMG